jgi:hypothetical protein
MRHLIQGSREEARERKKTADKVRGDYGKYVEK